MKPNDRQLIAKAINALREIDRDIKSVMYNFDGKESNAERLWDSALNLLAARGMLSEVLNDE